MRSVEKYFLKDETLLRVRHAIPTPKWGMYSKHPHGRGSIGVGFSSISHPSSPTSTQRQPLQFRTPREWRRRRVPKVHKREFIWCTIIHGWICYTHTHTMLCVDALRNGINGPEPTSPLKKRTRMTHDSALGLASLAYYIYNNGHDGRAIRGTYYGIQQNDVCCRHFIFVSLFFLFSPFTLKRHAGKHRT